MLLISIVNSTANFPFPEKYEATVTVNWPFEYFALVTAVFWIVNSFAASTHVYPSKAVSTNFVKASSLDSTSFSSLVVCVAVCLNWANLISPSTAPPP